MITIKNVAEWFLSRESMTHKKLQKLCYYAQAWHYTLYDCRLFDGDFEAWAHGPVNRELWYELKSFEYREIPCNELEKYKYNFDSKATDFLETVWNTYGEFDGSQLEGLTHNEMPWIKARNGLGAYQKCTTQIQPCDMKDYYKSIYTGDGVGE